MHFRGNTRIFALFFMVLDLRLVKIGCRDDNQFFLLPTLPAPRHVLAYTPNNRLFVRALHAAHEPREAQIRDFRQDRFLLGCHPHFAVLDLTAGKQAEYAENTERTEQKSQIFRHFLTDFP